jgi:hypothetical protein
LFSPDKSNHSEENRRDLPHGGFSFLISNQIQSQEA